MTNQSSTVSSAPVKKKRAWPILLGVYFCLAILAVWFFQLYGEQVSIEKEKDCYRLFSNVSYEFVSNDKAEACNSWTKFKTMDCKADLDVMNNYNEYCGDE